MAEVKQPVTNVFKVLKRLSPSGCLNHGDHVKNDSLNSVELLLVDSENCGRCRSVKVAVGASHFDFITVKPAPVSPDRDGTQTCTLRLELRESDASGAPRFRTSLYRKRRLGDFWGQSPDCVPHRHLYREHGPVLFFRGLSRKGSENEPLYRTKNGYYEVLEVAPTATQAQIKTAYYKQSFRFHPDRNAGSDAATSRFSEISEAYGVLGNSALRRKYDRGMLGPADLSSPARPSAAAGKSGSRGESGGGSVGGVYQGGTYDFDKFFKSHYSEQLQREKDLRELKERHKKKMETKTERKLERMAEVGLAAGIIFTIVMFVGWK